MSCIIPTLIDILYKQRSKSYLSTSVSCLRDIYEGSFQAELVKQGLPTKTISRLGGYTQKIKPYQMDLKLEHH